MNFTSEFETVEALSRANVPLELSMYYLEYLFIKDRMSNSLEVDYNSLSLMSCSLRLMSCSLSLMSCL